MLKPCTGHFMLLALALAGLACSAQLSANDDSSEGSGGATTSGGAAGSAGSSKGGASSSGGATTSGGAAGSAGTATAGTAGTAGAGTGGGTAGTSSGGTGSGYGGTGYGGTGLGGTGAAGLTGTSGVWEDVTPDGINLSSDFGAQDVLADPANPGIFYGFVCLQGVYKSTDWGTTWAHVSTGNDLEPGRPWGQAMAPDGSYMLAASGYASNGNQGAWKSTDGGVTWESYDISNDNDPYNYDIELFDKDHVLTAMHASDHIYESTDGGETWADKGSSGAGGSNYVFFITDVIWLAISQDGSGNGTRRTTNSGSSWAEVGDMEHAHGNAQIFIDPDNGHIYAAGHNNGVYRSTNQGETFTQVSNTRGSTVYGTATKLYSMDPGANGAGTAPMFQTATRATGTDWTAPATPAGMTNGTKRAATMYDAESERWVIVAGNWNAGFWRYIE